MIDALVAGKVFRQFTARTSRAGSTFCTGKVRVASREGAALFVNVIAFNAAPVTALMALEDGDSCAISGELTPGVWTDKNGEARPQLDLVAHAVVSPYTVKRKRAASSDKPTPQNESAGSGGSAGHDPELDGAAVPF